MSNPERSTPPTNPTGPLHAKSNGADINTGNGWKRFLHWFRARKHATGAIIGAASVVLTAIACLQTFQSDHASRQQFDESGPAYSWFMLDPINPGLRIDRDTVASTPSYAIVITNRGRTDDSIIGIQQVIDGTTHEMHPCVPDFDEDGILNERRPIRPDSASIRIAAGDARLVILVGETSRTTLDTENGTNLHGVPFAITDSLLVHTASGRDVEAQRDTTVSKSTLDHYEYPQLGDAINACVAHVEQRP